MAKLVDPDSLNQATEVVIDTSAKTIRLLVAGNLFDTAPGASSGVTGKALYSFLKEEWKTDTTLNRHKFPVQMIYEASFIWINDWLPYDQQTRDLIRDAGFKENKTGRENACVISLGSFNAPATDLAYYQQVTGFSASVTNFDKTGELNENVLTLSGAINYTGYLKTFLRVQGKVYSEYNLLSEQGLSALTYQAYRLPLANSTDLNITAADATIDTTAPYTGMSGSFVKGTGFTSWANTTSYGSGYVVYNTPTGRWYFTIAGGTSSGTSVADDVGVTWEAFSGERQIGTNYYAFNRIISANAGAKEEIYEWAQRQLRKSTNINGNHIGSPNQDDFGTVNGNVAKLLLEFVGSTLVTKGGVYIDNFDTNDTNSIEFYDITVGSGLTSEYVPVLSTKRTFPYVAAGTLNFSSNLVSEPDVDTRYAMYYNYITRKTGTDIAISGAAGANARIHGTSTSFAYLVTNDWLLISGCTNPNNSGLWKATANGTALSGSIQKMDGINPSNEAAGNNVQVDENPFNSDGALIVNRNAGTPISGQIAAASVNWDYDYDGNTQGGRTAATDAYITVVAQGLSGAQWTLATATISRSTGQSISVNAVDELNYSNPV